MRTGWLTAGPEMACPSCGARIRLENVNVATDVALCRECGRSFSFAGMVEERGKKDGDVEMPPGCEFEELAEGFRVRGTTRSWAALFYIPFTCVWSGGSLSGIYGTQIRQGRFSLFDSLFGLMFVAGTVMLVGACAMSVAGRVEVAVQGEELTLFSGVGLFGWRKRLVWPDYDGAREEVSRGNKGRVSLSIVLEGRKRVSFGSGLSEERRYWMLQVLRRRMAERQKRAGRNGDWG